MDTLRRTVTALAVAAGFAAGAVGLASTAGAQESDARPADTACAASTCAAYQPGDRSPELLAEGTYTGDQLGADLAHVRVDVSVASTTGSTDDTPPSEKVVADDGCQAGTFWLVAVAEDWLGSIHIDNDCGQGSVDHGRGPTTDA